MSALIEACKDDAYPAQIGLVLSNTPDAKGLDIAKQAGLQTDIVNHQEFSNRESFEDALLSVIQNHDIDLICLAGFMRILTAHFIGKFGKPILNIHPSLLPDYKGLNTHERVIEDQKARSGCSVHFVTEELDSGDIIVQRDVAVYPDDTPDTLAARVLEQEHVAYPEALKIVADKILH